MRSGMMIVFGVKCKEARHFNNIHLRKPLYDVHSLPEQRRVYVELERRPNLRLFTCRRVHWHFLRT